MNYLHIYMDSGDLSFKRPSGNQEVGCPVEEHLPSIGSSYVHASVNSPSLLLPLPLSPPILRINEWQGEGTEEQLSSSRSCISLGLVGSWTCI